MTVHLKRIRMTTPLVWCISITVLLLFASGSGWFRFDPIKAEPAVGEPTSRRAEPSIDSEGIETLFRSDHRASQRTQAVKPAPVKPAGSRPSMAPARAEVCGSVIDEEGIRVEFASVFAEAVPEEVTTDTEGSFALVSQESVARLIVDHPSYQPLVFELRPPVHPGEARQVELTLSKGSTACIIVTDSDYRPLENAQVSSWSSSTSGHTGTLIGGSKEVRLLQRLEMLAGKTARSGLTDSDGHLCLEGLTPGTYEVLVDHPSNRSSRLDFRIEDHQLEIDLGTVRLLPGIFVEGEVVNELNLPIPGAMVQVVAAGAYKQTVTDDEGIFVLEGLPEESMSATLLVEHPDHSSHYDEGLSVAEGSFHSIALDPGMTIDFLLRDAVDQELITGEARIEITGGSGRLLSSLHRSRFRTVKVTDGRASLQHVGPQARGVSLSVAGYAPQWVDSSEWSGMVAPSLSLAIERDYEVFVDVRLAHSGERIDADLELAIISVRDDGSRAVGRVVLHSSANTAGPKSAFRIPSECLPYASEVLLTVTAPGLLPSHPIQLKHQAAHPQQERFEVLMRPR